MLSVVIVGVAFLVSGCANKSVQAKNSGFFKDYERLKSSGDFSAVKTSKEVDMTKYKTILIAPVKVISAIPQEKQTPLQKKLYKEISDYLTQNYKDEIAKSTRYKLTETKNADTLMLETAISTVEVHFDDEKWNQFSPISMGITVVSYNSYLDEDVRILGEKRIIDSTTGEVLVESMNIIKDEKIIIESDNLEFSNLKPALDGWLEHIKNYFSK